MEALDPSAAVSQGESLRRAAPIIERHFRKSPFPGAPRSRKARHHNAEELRGDPTESRVRDHPVGQEARTHSAFDAGLGSRLHGKPRKRSWRSCRACELTIYVPQNVW